LAQQDIAPYFNMKLSKSGGLHHAATISRIAETAGISCMLGCMSESKLGITAAAHFGAAHSAFRFFDLDSHLEHAENPILGGINIEGGMIQLPDEPGIGAEPGPQCLSKMEEIG
jgi:L-alanine-DL-glutamate epimerase-like enolase superfamily enzyme